MKILIVDDEPGFSITLKKWLNAKGYDKIKVAHTGMDALRSIETSFYDFIFLDLSIPDINGMIIFETIKKNSRSKCKDSKVVIVTGWPSVGTAVKCMKMGATDYLSKPIKYESILRILNENDDDCIGQ